MSDQPPRKHRKPRDHSTNSRARWTSSPDLPTLAPDDLLALCEECGKDSSACTEALLCACRGVKAPG